MAYQDPYYNNSQYAQKQQQYTDAPEFDPYTTNQQRHPTYDQGLYTDDEAYPKKGPTTEPIVVKEQPVYQDAPFPPPMRPPTSTGAIRSWRQDHHGNLWTSGGRGRCVGRFCCCSLLIFFFLLASLILTLAVWIRPPNIAVNDVGLPDTGSAFQVTSNSLNLNLGVNISVDNPNYFSVAFRTIRADLIYPINNTAVGGGEKNDIVFPSHSQKTFTFPFTLTYTTTTDPDKAVLTDLLTKCGIIGGVKSSLKVNYKITLGLRILFVTISPSFSNSFDFDCPVSKSDLTDLLKGSGLNIDGLGN